MRRRKKYFKKEQDTPTPIEFVIRRRPHFGEVDAMAIMWHGNYAILFEEVSTELRRVCGLGYNDFFVAGIRAPIVQLTVDYILPLELDELATVKAQLIWTEAARLNIEYEIKKEDGRVAATGCTIQLFVEEASGLPCFTIPDIFDACRKRWRAGEFEVCQ